MLFRFVLQSSSRHARSCDWSIFVHQCLRNDCCLQNGRGLSVWQGLSAHTSVVSIRIPCVCVCVCRRFNAYVMVQQRMAKSYGRNDGSTARYITGNPQTTNCMRLLAYLRPTVAFQIDQQFLGDTDDVQSSAEAINVDPIMIDLQLIASLPKCLQLQSRCSLAVARDGLKTSDKIIDRSLRIKSPSRASEIGRWRVKCWKWSKVRVMDC